MLRRAAWRVGVCCLLGGATAVGAAWSIAILIERRGYGCGLVLDGSLAKNAPVKSNGLVADPVFWQRSPVYESYYFTGWFDPTDFPDSNYGPFTRVPQWCMPVVDEKSEQHWALAFGWPFPAFYFEAAGWDLARREGVDFEYRGAAIIGKAKSGYVLRLPLLPIASGLALNTGLFGSLWYAALFAPWAARRRLRTRRGLCQTCGYDRQGLVGPCPECGSVP